MAQKLVMANHGEGVNVLIVDSDIYLPDEFGKLYSDLTVESDKLYGIENCLDFHTYNDFIQKKNAHIHHAVSDIIGCFNLFKQTSQKLYVNSESCAECDILFRDLFLINGVPAMKFEQQYIVNEIKRIEYYTKNNCIYLPLTVHHLGYCNTNWNGRKEPDTYIQDLTNTYDNNFEGKTLNIYTQTNNILTSKYICKCIFLDNNKLTVKLIDSIIYGKYEILSDFICRIKFYSMDFLCMIITNIDTNGKLTKKIPVYDLKYSIEYRGQFIN